MLDKGVFHTNKSEFTQPVQNKKRMDIDIAELEKFRLKNIDKNDLDGGSVKPGNSLTNALSSASRTSAGYSDA